MHAKSLDIRSKITNKLGIFMYTNNRLLGLVLVSCCLRLTPVTEGMPINLNTLLHAVQVKNGAFVFEPITACVEFRIDRTVAMTDEVWQQIKDGVTCLRQALADKNMDAASVALDAFEKLDAHGVLSVSFGVDQQQEVTEGAVSVHQKNSTSVELGVECKDYVYVRYIVNKNELAPELWNELLLQVLDEVKGVNKQESGLADARETLAVLLELA